VEAQVLEIQELGLRRGKIYFSHRLDLTNSDNADGGGASDGDATGDSDRSCAVSRRASHRVAGEGIFALRA
jgi:hypothetical protein